MSLTFSMFEKKDRWQKPTFFLADDKIGGGLKKEILQL